MDTQYNIVSYRCESVEAPYWPANVLPCLVLIGLILAAAGQWRRIRPAAGRVAAAKALIPWLFGLVVIGFFLTLPNPRFWFAFPLILSASWMAWWTTRTAGDRELNIPLVPSHERASKGGGMHAVAFGSLVLLIGILTWSHTLLQVNFWEHFSLGYADIGFYAQELESARHGRLLPTDDGDETYLSLHFAPLLYVLTPVYALAPTLVVLMVCGALFVHLPAIPVYFFARRATGSAGQAWVWAIAWLFLPTQSRLIYCGTYGFQWVYAALPLMALMIGSGLAGRWRWSLTMAVLVLLVQETMAPAVFGWGLYLALFTPRRKSGLLLAAGSTAYLLLCTYVIVPHFAPSGRYERFSMLGDLGTSPPGLLDAGFAMVKRIVRPQAAYYLLTLLVPMGMLPFRNWRLLLAAAPPLIPILLIANTEFLSIKFWHCVTLLPFLFFAAMSPRSVTAKPADHPGIAAAIAVLVGAAMGHWLFAYSPLSQSYRVYANTAAFHAPDPRLAFVRQLRSEIGKEHTILATERLAAHFTDYHGLYTGISDDVADYVVLDRSDTWDTTGLPARAAKFATDARYLPYRELGSIVVYERRTTSERQSREGLEH